jgi:hypothetical protein
MYRFFVYEFLWWGEVWAEDLVRDRALFPSGSRGSLNLAKDRPFLLGKRLKTISTRSPHSIVLTSVQGGRPNSQG